MWTQFLSGDIGGSRDGKSWESQKETSESDAVLVVLLEDSKSRVFLFGGRRLLSGDVPSANIIQNREIEYLREIAEAHSAVDTWQSA
jgi:hypothetical protein